ncbi:helix-turn-helix domain-containing protein [Burkholderia gladioli]|uniref:helix-turn-helix domain-containing protein n=1 Tax=Burkholderia gladioli TaxID=28095 RepID=UPI0016407D48|nr:helix-turn-helix transcriptional regulator [Burkholderia gladioli]
MSEPTNSQRINQQHSKPAHAQRNKEFVPHDVARRLLVDEVSPQRAWRDHLGLTQAAVAARLGITLYAYTQQERAASVSKSSLHRIAAALGVTAEQLDI